jgi:hypothetical protein
MTEQERTIGRLEAQVGDLREDVKNLHTDLAEIKELVQMGRGAKWAIGFMAAIIGFVSSQAKAWLAP